jgi:hypothetical protein
MVYIGGHGGFDLSHLWQANKMHSLPDQSYVNWLHRSDGPSEGGPWRIARRR